MNAYRISREDYVVARLRAAACKLRMPDRAAELSERDERRLTQESLNGRQIDCEDVGRVVHSRMRLTIEVIRFLIALRRPAGNDAEYILEHT